MGSKFNVKMKGQTSTALKKLEEISKNFDGPDIVKVGLPKGANDYPDGTSVLMVGAVHEFGSPARSIPQRSYLRSTVVEKKSKYKTMFRKLSKQMVEGKINKEKALMVVGLKTQTDVRNKITNIKVPELKYRDGNPLVDTGHLRQAIFFTVN